MALNPRPPAVEENVESAPIRARVPFGSMVQKLAYPARPGFHRHWFNDEPGRVDRALEAGYKHVEHEDGAKKGEKVSKVVGRFEGGTPIIGYLMEIPQEWYDADMKEEQLRIDEREETIRRGKMQGAVAKDETGRYYDSAQGRGISIKRG